MSATDREYLNNTHDAIRLFYTILLTIGLSQGFVRTFTDGSGQALSLYNIELVSWMVFLVFVLVVVRFFLGGVRHLDDTYIETPLTDLARSTEGKQWYRAFDFGLLTFDAALIIAMGTSIRMLHQFFTLFMILLIIDAIWALSINQLAEDSREHQEITTLKKWGLINAITFVLLLLAFAINSWINMTSLFIVIGFLNSFADLYWTNGAYFPPLEES